MSSWKHLREEGRHFAKKHRVGAKRALVGVLIAAMTISTMNVPAIAEELGITADAQEQIIQDSTVNTENQSATAEGTPAEGTDATVNEGDDPADTSADAATDTTADTQPADDQQPDEAVGTESDQNNLTEGSSENDPAAVEEDTTAQVAVKVANASLKYTDANGAEQTVSENKDAVDFPTQTEIKFSVTANDGFQASRVFYTVDGADTDVAADESGVYTIPAEAVNDGLAITVETAEIPAADEPAADDAAGEADGVATLTINVENSSVTLTNAEGEEQTLTESQDVEVAADEDLALTVEPAEDYELESVTVTDADKTSEVSGEDGVYTIPADQVIDNATLSIRSAAPGAQSAENDIESLSISGQKRVAIGETIRLSSDSPASSGGWRPKTYTHKWTASPSNAVSFSNTSNSGADVTGNRAGTVTINHEWGYDGWLGWQKEGSETYTITVYQADEEDLCTITFDTNGGNWNNSLNGTHKFVMGHELWPEGQDLSVPTRNGYVFEGWTPAVSRVVSDDATYTAQWKQVGSNLTPVYVYLQVNGDTSGLILNYSGWYTVGVIYMPSNLVPNTGLYQDQTVNLNNQRVAQALDEAMKSIVRYGPNESLVIDDATWTKLHVQAGANDYVAEGSAWHLDGEIDAKYLANLTVNHIDMDTQEIMRTDTSVRTVGTSVNPGDMVRSFKNYTYDHSEPNHAITIQKNGENVINIYYQKNADRLFYDANGGESTMSPSVGKAEEQVTVEENGFTRDGYEFTGWNTEADGSGKDYDPGDKYTLTDGEDKLFAQWKENADVTYTYTALTGGTATPGSEKVAPATGTAQGSTAAPAAGYSFDGWYDNEGCEGDPVTTDAKIVPEKTGGAYTGGQFWAKFSENADVTLTYVAQTGGSVSPTSETLAPATGEAEGSTATAAAGYTFVNWTVDGEEVSTDAALTAEVVDSAAKKSGAYEATTFTANFKVDLSNFQVYGYSWVYDGTAKTVDVRGIYPGDTVTYAVGEKEYECTVNADGEIEGAPNFKNVVDTISEISITVTRGGVTSEAKTAQMIVTPVEIAVSGEDTSVYDGLDHTLTITQDSTVKYNKGAKVEGEDLVVNATITGKLPGDYTKLDEGPSWSITNGDKSNYRVTITGKLTITDRPDGEKFEITAFAPDAEYLYDGKEHTAKGVTFDNLTFNGITYTVEGLTASVTQIDAGNYPTGITGTAKVVDPDGNDVTDQFTVDTSDLGMLVISRRQVTLTSDSAIKLYDGTPLKAENVTVSGDGWADGEGATYTYGDGQTVVGTSSNTFEYTLNEGTKSGNYDIDEVEGKLTVFSSSINPDDDPLPDPDDPDYPQPGDEDKPYYSGVTVDTPKSVDYDGKDHKWVPTVLDKDGNPLPEENYTVTYLDEDGSEVDNFVDVKTITVIIEGQNGYTGKVERSYEIRKIDLTVTTESASKVYDGSPLTASGKVEGLIEGDATFTVTGTITNEGTETNTYKLDWVGNKADNYNITENLGKLTIIAQSIDPDDKPDPDDPDKPTYGGVWVSDAPTDIVYDGQPHQWIPTVLDKENGEPLPEGSYSVTYVDDEGNTVDDFTNVTGDIHVVITGEGNYTGQVERVYHIDPRPLDVVIPEQTKTYDGTEDVIHDGDITLNLGDTYIANDAVVATIAPENVKFAQADVHEDGDLVASINNVTLSGDDARNYELRNISGIGSITQAGVTGFALSASGYSGAYDGQAHDAVTSAVVTEKAQGQQRDAFWEITYSLTEDGTYTADMPTVTNVADSTTVYVKASNANYGEMVIPVQATVTPLTLTVTANNQTKVAGTADPALTSTYTGALPGETPGWTGTIARVPGEAAGTYQIFQNTLGIEDNGAFLADNYTLVFVNGTLTITAAPGGGDNPDDGGDDTPTTPTTPTTPGTTTDGGTPTVIEDAPEQPEPEQIDDDENPLAGTSESIDDDGTPLARPTHQDCWVHWLMILGIIVTAIYDVLVLIRRRKFTGTLASFEDEVLNDRNRNA